MGSRPRQPGLACAGRWGPGRPRAGIGRESAAGRRGASRGVAARLVTEPAPAQAQEQYRQVLSFGTELAVALDDLHLAAVDEPGATGCHPGLTAPLGHLGAPFH